MQDSRHMLALQLCLVAAFIAAVYSECSLPNSLSFAVLRNSDERKSYPIGTNLTYRCKPGYEPIPGTRPVIRCLETSEWSEIPQFCQGRHCPFPNIENGKIATMTDFRLGDQITFACNEGYRLIGQNGARCMLLAGRVVWNRNPPPCQRIPCLPPPTIANGKHSSTDSDDNYVHGSAVTYDCESGFSLIGKKTIVCTTDENDTVGKWSGSAPRCEVECRRPEVSNGRIISSYQRSYIYGNTVMFECYRGYILQGENVIKCEANNTWNPAPPKCVLRDCDPPRDVPFAVLSSEEQRESYPVGTSLTYNCIPGYEYIWGQKLTIRCLTTSEWSESHQFCQKRKCPFPKIQNGRLAARSDLFFDSEITFICNEGHRLIGHNTARCVLEDGNVVWNRDIPRCERIPCLPPPAIANGTFRGSDGDTFLYGSKVQYWCDSGLSLIGENIISCIIERSGLNTKWSGPAPECKVVSCNRPEVPKGQIFPKQASYTYGDTVHFLCSLGHILKGSRISKCEVDSSWHPAPPTCVLGSCDPPTGLYFAELLDAYKNQSSYPVGSVVKYKCQPGYTKQLELPSFIQCLTSMKWSSVLVHCEKQSCGNPGEPENGRLIEPKDFLFGSSINFTCDEGYSLIGQSSIQCVVSGQKVTWSGEIPLCQRRQCPFPKIENGKIANESDFHLGDQIMFQCDEGHRLIGHNGARCVLLKNNNVDWDKDPPYCEHEILLPSSGPNVTSTFPTYTSSLPTLQTELAWEKLFIILQEIKDLINIKTKSFEERLDGLEKKVDKVIYEMKSCCQQSREERLEEEVEEES
ncbi:complement component receptor 1-like protein isoform X2 [Eublepharis macularius]|uniref:Complement component receptor 1-like protein isoform X2 n=1 Tax=Eublepharis macularius TaxID=481883 RepID=A0AA97JDJ3_EUBMA|nr:complement component receptor 1-like protein isoform X2 [Eublepharis macularius]